MLLVEEEEEKEEKEEKEEEVLVLVEEEAARQINDWERSCSGSASVWGGRKTGEEPVLASGHTVNTGLKHLFSDRHVQLLEMSAGSSETRGMMA